MRTWIIAVTAVLATLVSTAAQAENVVRWATPEPVLTWDPYGADSSYTQMGHRQRLRGPDPPRPELPSGAGAGGLVEARRPNNLAVRAAPGRALP